MPWLALLFFRAFFLRAFFAMLCLLVLVTVPSAAGRGGGRGVAPRLAGADPHDASADAARRSAVGRIACPVVRGPA